MYTSGVVIMKFSMVTASLKVTWKSAITLPLIKEQLLDLATCKYPNVKWPVKRLAVVLNEIKR